MLLRLRQRVASTVILSTTSQQTFPGVSEEHQHLPALTWGTMACICLWLHSMHVTLGQNLGAFVYEGVDRAQESFYIR